MRKRRLKNELVASDASASDQEQLEEILRKLGANNNEWFMITQETIFPAEGRRYGSREDFMVDLGGALTCHHHVLAIFHQGRRIQDHETEGFKREALDDLGPISRARADGRL
jgi:hypothetical protein